MKASLTTLTLLAAAAVGVGAGALVFADATPAALRPAASATAAPVTQRSFDDRHTVEVALTLGADTTLTTPASGRVTALSCQSGAIFRSGQTNLSVDGQRIVNLATSVPMWRDVTRGDKGEDVAALQRELARLGYSVTADGTVGRATLAAVADLFHTAGDARAPLETVAASRLLWLPAAETTIGGCATATGATVTEGEKVASLPGGLAGAAITRVPETAVDGERTLTIDGMGVPVDADGRVTTADALAAIAASDSYARAMSSDATTVTGVSTLTTPVTVWAVPAGALYGIDAPAACVATGGSTHAVRIVASELGQSFVTFDRGDAPKAVDLAPSGARSCR